MYYQLTIALLLLLKHLDACHSSSGCILCYIIYIKIEITEFLLKNISFSYTRFQPKKIVNPVSIKQIDLYKSMYNRLD
jgi:hypothetical protein